MKKCDHVWEPLGPNSYRECKICRVGELLENPIEITQPGDVEPVHIEGEC